MTTTADRTNALPPGWQAFCSKPSPQGVQGRWYATPPWTVSADMERAGLVCTVAADTWGELQESIAEQIELHDAVIGHVH